MDCMDRMTPGEVAAATTLGWQFDAEQMGAMAESWLLEGWDTSALRELAASTTADNNVPLLWSAALDELALSTPDAASAAHLLARRMVRRWPERSLPDASKVEHLRAMLVHGAQSRAGTVWAWPTDDTFRALGHLGARLRAAGATAGAPTATERQLADELRGVLAAELSGRCLSAGYGFTAMAERPLVDEREEVRRLVSRAPGFAWEDVALHDDDCRGECQNEWSVARWVATIWAAEPQRHPLAAMADDIEDLLLNAHRPAASNATSAFLLDLYPAARSNGISYRRIAAELGPVARDRWSEVVSRYVPDTAR